MNLYKIDNQEVTEKMFSMMEKFTKRIVDIENHMNDKNWKKKKKWNKRNIIKYENENKRNEWKDEIKRNNWN